jgi:hypothetical protein
VLSQWIGTWQYKSAAFEYPKTCSWAGTFVACDTQSKAIELLGYEPNNRRYVSWTVSHTGVAQLSGAAGPSEWSLEGPGGRVVWKRTSATTWTQHVEDQGQVEDGVFTATTPPPPPPAATPTPPAASVDWRAELQALVGTWTFTGTFAGQPLSYSEDCAWLPASTFVFCKNAASSAVTLTGWEPQLQRFAAYGFDGDQPVHVLAGTLENHNFTFTDGKATLSMTRKSPLEYQLRGTAPTGETFEGSYVTKPE